jgi:hypothetical protein
MIIVFEVYNKRLGLKLELTRRILIGQNIVTINKTLILEQY